MPKKVDKDKKARAIAAAGLKVFSELGYTATRMADIAQKAGLGKGTLYEYFKNKADILRFSFEQYFLAFRQGAGTVMAKGASPAAKLLLLVEFALDHVEEWQDHCAVYVDYFGAARTGEADSVVLTGFYQEMSRLLKELIEAGQRAGEIENSYDAPAAAELLVSFYDGIVLHRVFSGRGCDRHLLRDAALKLLARGLLSDREQGPGSVVGQGV